MNLPEEASPAAPRATQTLLALIVGQIGLHSAMAGLRMAMPLWVLRGSHSEWAVGVLVGLFAMAPVLLALRFGRLVDRHGYHGPLRLAVAMTMAGGAFALLGTALPRPFDFVAFCAAAMAAGSGANCGLIAIQRAAGRHARDVHDLKRVFGWMGMAPALSNAIGPMLAGFLIDLGGFRVAFTAMLLLPLPGLWWARRVPHDPPAPRAAQAPRSSFELLRLRELRRLLLVNWMLSACWDVHTFVVPILGHERGFSASAIGFVLAVFAVAVALVRVAIPTLAHRLSEAQVLVGAMLGTGAVFAVYPLVRSAWTMALCATLLGLALGAVQPMIMSALHQVTPPDRHGEAIALRMMAMNTSSTLMPLLFGVLGSALGAASLFWLMGAIVMAGTAQARHVRATAPPEP